MEGINILFVDDEPGLLDQSKVFLEREDDDFRVVTTTNVKDALELLENDDFDVIVSDYQMPEMTGLEFLKILRKQRREDIPFIIFTGRGREEVAMEALNLGADRYIQKGGDPRSQYGVLASEIRQEFERYNAEKSLSRKNKLLIQIFERSQEGFYIRDTSGGIKYVNQAFADIHGYTRDDLIGSDSRELLTEEFRKRLKGIALDDLINGEIEVEIERGDGEVRTIENVIFPLRGRRGEIQDVFGISRDITDKRREEERKERCIDELKHINEAIFTVGKLDERGEICQYLADKIYEINGKNPVIVSLSDDGPHTVKIKGIAGFGEPTSSVEEGLQDLKIVLRRHSLDSELVEIEGNFSQVVSGIFNEKICDQMGGSDIDKVFFIDISNDDRLYGGIYIITIDGSEIENKHTIETMVQQISVLLGKRKIERELELTKHSVDNASIGVFWVDPEGRFVYTNEAVTEMLGYTQNELQRMHIWDIDPEFFPDEREGFWDDLKMEGSIKKESVNQRKDGEIFPVEIISNHIVHHGRELEFAFVKDISDRKKAEERAEEMRSLRDAIRDVNQIIVKGSDLDEVMQKTCDTLSESRGYQDVSIFVMDDRGNLRPVAHSGGHKNKLFDRASVYEEISSCMKEVMDSNESLTIESVYEQCGDCDLCMHEEDHSSVLVPFIKGDDIKGLMMICLPSDREITEEEEDLLKEVCGDLSFARDKFFSEKKLREGEDKIRRLYAAAPRIEQVNTLRELYELTVEEAREILGFDVCSVIIHEEDYLMIRASSEEDLVDVHGMMDDEGVAGMTYQSQESYLMKDLKGVERAKPTDERFRSAMSIPIKEHGVFQALSYTPAYYSETDLELAELFIAMISEAITRLRVQEELKKSEERLGSYIHNAPHGVLVMDSEGSFLEVNEAAVKITGYSDEELLSMNMVDMVELDAYDKVLKYLSRLVEKGEIHVELPFIRKDASSGYWSISATRITEDRFICFAEDISDKKEAEKREEFLHTLLRHDVKNKIQVIQGYLQLLEETSELSEEMEYFVQNAEKGVEGSIELIDKVGMLRRAQIEEIRPVKITPIVATVVDSITDHVDREGIDLRLRYVDDDIYVIGGPLLHEVLTNIINNSIQHSGCNRIQISVEKVDDGMVCRIEDDGKGIPDSKKGRIFNKGYTTDSGKGSGLGLFLAEKVIEKYGGSIEIRDSEMGGARFDVRLMRDDGSRNK